MSRTIGYVVSGYAGLKRLNPEIVPEGCYKGVLQNGGAATLFKTRARAKSAIDRTIKYAREAGYDNKMWVGNLHIRRMEGEA